MFGNLPKIDVVQDAGYESSLHDEVFAALLKRRRPSAKRRSIILNFAHMMLTTIDRDKCSSADLAWIKKMAEQPAAAEKDALSVWNQFVLDCRLPSSFKVPSRKPLSIGNLVLLRMSGESGNIDSFANYFPWPTRSILNSKEAEQDLQVIEADKKRYVEIAARHLCCQKESDCKKAIRFAELVSRRIHRKNAGLDRLLGDDTYEGCQLRSLFLEAHWHDPELISHVSSDSVLTKRQIRFAIEALFEYNSYRRVEQIDPFECSFYLATLLTRMMVRGDRFDPNSVDLEQVILGLIAVSADCLAAFVEESIDTIDPDLSVLDTGVLALLRLLGKPKRPRLTITQFLKFAAQANDNRQYQIDELDFDFSNDLGNWPDPPGWKSSLFNSEQVHIRFLSSADSLFDEGIQMSHCLINDRYRRASMLGARFVFSMTAENGKRATLSIKPVTGSQKTRIDSFEIDQLKGPKNSEPDPAFEAAANLLLKKMQDECPVYLDQKECERRLRVRRTLEGWSYNRDIETAKENWAATYRHLLPKPFADLQLEDVIKHL